MSPPVIVIHPSARRGGLQAMYLETAVPFAAGALAAPTIQITGGQGEELPAQAHVLATWPDGSIKWLQVICRTPRQPGALRLRAAATGLPEAPPLAREDGESIAVDTGRLAWSIPRHLPVPLEEEREPLLGGIVLRQRGREVAVTARSPHGGLLARAADGRLYGTARAAATWRAWVHRAGPLHGVILATAALTHSGRKTMLTCRLRLDVWRDSPLLRLAVTWLNAAENPPALVADIRYRLPLAFALERVELGCAHGICTVPVAGDDEVYVLQDDAERYRAMRAGWGAPVELASGGAGGRQAPGWAIGRGQGAAIGVWVPRFAAEYPNELSLRTRELAVGLWPERANPAIVRRHRLLPRGPEPAPYGRGPDYDSLMAQPYWACIDPERACLEAIPGLAKTQEFVLDLAPPAAARFARAARLGHLAPDRGVVEPAYVASTEVFGRTLAAGAPGCAPVDRLTARALGWFERHMDGGWTWGKFDYGDLRYIVFTPESRLGRAYRGTERFPRAGYWNNNENDPLQGLLAHFHLTDQRRAWPLALQAARHLLDVDVRHGDDTGLYTHSFGHCYRAMSHRSMDHLWLDGLATYCCVCDDPFARQDLDGLRRMALAEFQQRPFAADNLRNFVLGITMNLMFHAATHAPGHLEGALAVARDLLAYQAPEGYFPGAGPTWAEQHRAGEGFPDEFAGPSTLSELHALEALHRLHEHSGAADVGEGFLRLARWFVRYNLHPARDAVQRFAMPQGERNPRGSGLFRSGDFFLLPGLAYAYRLTGDPEFARIGARLLRHLCATQLGRRPHPLWEGNWFEHAAVVSADATRTVPQDPYAPDAEFNYITPLSPSFALYKVREMLWAIADAGATPELQEAT